MLETAPNIFGGFKEALSLHTCLVLWYKTLWEHGPHNNKLCATYSNNFVAV
jgi:hypothetical protein